MIKVLLWDIDGTLLCFLKAEYNALLKCFNKFGLGTITDELINDYSEINKSFWKRLELGEITKKEVLVGRFVKFFEKNGFPTDCVEELNEFYQRALGEEVFFNDNGYEVVNELKKSCHEYATTNGTLVAQRLKLKKSGLDQLFEKAFVSEEVGFEKPSKSFFDKVIEEIPPCKLEEIMIIGDSLSSDIKGGNNAGILCCWYNPLHEENNTGLRVDYEIDNLNQVKNIVAERK